MQQPGSARSESGLRGDYTAAGTDFTVPQNWGSYTPEMHERWRRLYARQAELTSRHAAREFVSGLARFDASGGIPKFEDANSVLSAATGWSLVAVPGFIPDDAFFAHLAARRFPVCRWLREEHELDYLVEPDVFHDFFGHVPMLLNPSVADFLELYGKAGSRAIAMGALDMLARIYWYSIEFGLIEQDGALKAFGAGIVSSAGETAFSVGDPSVMRLRFNPERMMRTGYMIDSFQRCYFVLDSLGQLIRGLVDLDFAPLYEQWRDAPPIPAGDAFATDRLWQANPS